MDNVHVKTNERWENVVVAVLVFVVLGLGSYAFMFGRATVRDELRLADLTNIKHALEKYNNIYTFYTTGPTYEVGCTYSDDPQSWFFGSQSPLLKAQVIDALPHDVRETPDRRYAYCTTSLSNNKTDGYYLEARLEVDQPDRLVFDEDEERKFYYRILHENDRIFLRLCGGVEKQCQPSEK